MVDYWERRADPDGTDEAAEAKKVPPGRLPGPEPLRYVGQMRFGSIDGAIVAEELKRHRRGALEADWAQAKERLGRDPHAGELCRTPASAGPTPWSRSPSARPVAPPPEPDGPSPSFPCWSASRPLAERISRSKMVPWSPRGPSWSGLGRAEFERIVWLPTRNRIECSKTARFLTGATKRAIEVRDRQCQHEYCDRPAGWCDIDHIVPWNEGRADRAGQFGQVLCGPHNRERYGRPPPEEPPDG